jgi:Phage protein Gp138 N-terminal domain
MADNTTPQSAGLGIGERLHTAVSQWTSALASHSKALRVAFPAIVVSFDPEKQTVAAQPAISEINNIGGVRTVQSLPLLVDVPVVLPRAGGFALTLPIQPGDECLVVFGDSCIDAWRQSGGRQNQFERRRHSLADGFAVFGPWSEPHVLANYSTSSAQLRSDDGATYIDIKGGQITLGNGVVTTDNLAVGNGWSGVFSTPTGKTVTVASGIIIDVS